MPRKHVSPPSPKKARWIILFACALSLAIVGVWHLVGFDNSSTDLPSRRQARKTIPVVKAPMAAPAPLTASGSLPTKKEIAQADRGYPVRVPASMGSLLSPEPPLFGKNRDRFAASPVLAQEDGPMDREGHYTRLKVVRTDMKYPLVRIEERRQRDPDSGEEKILGSMAMVADHVMLRLEPGYTTQDLERLASATGMQIRKAGTHSRLYLLAFDLGQGNDVHALDKSIAVLKTAKMVGAPEPDYIVSAN